MGLCENTGSWRRWISAGMLGVMLLAFSSAQTLHDQASCSAPPGNVTQPQYHDTVKTKMDYLAPFVQSFLYTVQPCPFPTDLIVNVVKNPSGLSDKVTKEILVYEVGFLVCIAIGVLYIILMPIVGVFLACCRCCGNCGGKMYQKQTPSIHCHRRSLYISTLLTTLIILAGNICMFRSNQDLNVSVDKGPVQLENTIDNIHTFLTAVPQQIDDVVNEGNRAIKAVIGNLDDIGPQVGTKIQQRLNGTFDPALKSLKRLNQESLNTTAQLDNLNSSVTQLQSSIDRVQSNVSRVRNEINQTLSKKTCYGCDRLIPELQKLTTDVTITIPPELKTFKSSLNEVIKADLVTKINEMEATFQSIPQKVTNETRDLVNQSKQLLNDTDKDISQVSSKIPLSVLGDVSQTLNQVQSQITQFSPTIQSSEFIRWSVCVALCCVVLLVVLCNLLGLVLGPLGLTPKADPRNRSCTADCGGIFFMMGAGFSFLFSWLFMIVVLLLFLLGGNIYSLLCQPWNNGQLLTIIDTSGLIPQLGPALGLKTNLSLSDIYRDCGKNRPLWTTLHLNELVNLEDFLNVSKYTGQIQEQFDRMNISLQIGTLLTPELKSKLMNISSSQKQFNTSTITKQINEIYQINLNTTADLLIELNKIQNNTEIQAELVREAMNLRQIQADIEITIFPQVKNLNSSIKSLQSTMEKLNGTVGEVLRTTGAAQDFLNTNTTQTVKTVTGSFLDCQLGILTVFADWANHTITKQVGRCGPVAGAIDSAEVMLCHNIVESLNAFWFSLGWCIMFFIPSILFSIKLAKYYRKMKYSDCFDDDHIIMNHIPRAQMKIV